MAAVRHLEFLGAYLKHPLEYLVVFIVAQNVVAIYAVVSIIQKFHYLTRLAGKMLTYAPKIVFLFDPVK